MSPEYFITTPDDTVSLKFIPGKQSNSSKHPADFLKVIKPLCTKKNLFP
jgi:hypothetical protein